MWAVRASSCSVSLRSQIAELKWDHFAMMRALERLCELAAERSRWAELPAPTRELVADLESHERQESMLLRNLFSTAAESR